MGTGYLVTNSAVVAAAMEKRGTVHKMQGVNDTKYVIGNFRPCTKPEDAENAIEEGAKSQKELDDGRLFIGPLNIRGAQVAEEEVQEANEAARQCHEQDNKENGAIAWDDVSGCE